VVTGKIDGRVLLTGTVEGTMVNGWARQIACPRNSILLIAFAEDPGKLCYDVHGARRQMAKTSLQTTFKKGEEVHTWISFRTGDFGLKADSVYTGKVKIK
jgi:hypothetical protein